ncbi:MAG: PIN domain-containing protein [bacterium]|nr:PIN domain-containing protein [bacterium]
MGPAFVDTSIWYAAADAGDADNHVAASLLAGHAGELVTSDVVLAELWSLVNARQDCRTANRLVGAITSGISRVECTTGADLEAASLALTAFGDQVFSLTDRTSWALMERLAITDALSLDDDFRIYRYGPQRRRAFTIHP